MPSASFMCTFSWLKCPLSEIAFHLEVLLIHLPLSSINLGQPLCLCSLQHQHGVCAWVIAVLGCLTWSWSCDFSGEFTLAKLSVCTLVCSHSEDFSGLNNYLDDGKVPVVMRRLRESECMLHTGLLSESECTLHIGVHVPLLLVSPF